MESEDILGSEVIKREVPEGEDANAANKKDDKRALPEIAAVATPSPATEAKEPG